MRRKFGGVRWKTGGIGSFGRRFGGLVVSLGKKTLKMFKTVPPIALGLARWTVETCSDRTGPLTTGMSTLVSSTRENEQ